MAGYIGSKAVILSTTGADISGNVVLSGTVDGRDVSVDGTKLDGIDTAAKDDQTAAEILTAVKTVDGAASGLDADLLDGQHGAYYTAYADTAVTNLVDNSPAALNTLNELAAALGDDASFSTTVTNSIAAKLPLAGGAMTGDLTVSGKVGINNSSPASKIDVLNGSANSQVASFSGADNGRGLKILTASTTRDDDTVVLKASDAFGEISFVSDNTEVMRINKDNNVLVGTTSAFGSSGITLGSNVVYAAGSSQNVANFQRYGSDGELIRLGKAGTTVGSISTQGGDLNIGTGACGIAFVDGVPAIYPWTTTGNTTRDAAIDLGDSGGRFKDLYLSGTATAGGITFPEGNVLNTITAPNTGMNFIVNSGSANVSRNFIFSSSTSGGSVTEKMRITSSGNVGIGTDAPTRALYVRKGTGAIHAANNYDVAVFQSNDAPGIRLVETGVASVAGIGHDNGNMNVAASGYLRFSTGLASNAEMYNGGTERMRITAAGGIQLGVASAIASGDAVQLNMANGSSGFFQRFMWANTTVGSINVNGSGVLYQTSSDYRLKTDVQPMVGASARIQALNPVNFEWIADGTRTDGFLAHEAKAVVPECVSGIKDAMMDQEYEVTPAVIDENGTETTAAVMGTRSVPDYQGIDQSKIVPLLTAALREALTKIDDMETRLAALEDV